HRHLRVVGVGADQFLADRGAGVDVRELHPRALPLGHLLAGGLLVLADARVGDGVEVGPVRRRALRRLGGGGARQLGGGRQGGHRRRRRGRLARRGGEGQGQDGGGEQGGLHRGLSFRPQNRTDTPPQKVRPYSAASCNSFL